MPKTLKDFDLETPPWLVEDWLPFGHRCMDTAPEGSFKTILGCWIAVCVASGTPLFGQPVHQGNVMLVDEETPELSLNYHLERLSNGLGLRYKDLPIYTLNMSGFRFDRKVQMENLLKSVRAIDPVFIRLDSMLAMLPGGRQSQSENDCHLGEIIRDNLNQLTSPTRTILLAAHSKKYIAGLTLDEIKEMQMQEIVRGHSSIVGEGCDTGFIIKKISEHPRPTMFCIITIVRRQAIPAGRIRYIELKEERYGEGWARLEEISPDKLPPSDAAIDVFPIFKVPDSKGNYNHSSQWILRTMAFCDRKYCRAAIAELLDRKAVVETGPQNYEMNPKRASQCNPDYLKVIDP